MRSEQENKIEKLEAENASLRARLGEAEKAFAAICKQDRVTRFRGTEQQFFEDGPCGKIARAAAKFQGGNSDA